MLTAEETQAVRDFKQFERWENRAMSEGVTTGGESDNPYVELARQVNITTNVWKGVNTAAVSWAFDSEGTEVSDDSPTLAQPTATVFMARGFLPYSIEVGQDYPGFAENLISILSAGYTDLEISKPTNGNGTTEPKGIVTALSANAAVRVKVATVGGFVVGDIYSAMEFLLGSPYELTDYMAGFPASQLSRRPTRRLPSLATGVIGSSRAAPECRSSPWAYFKD